MRKKVMVVEDDRIVARDLVRILESMGYEVPAAAADSVSAITRAAEHRPDLVLMDIRLEDEGSGIDAAMTISREYGLPVIFLTAYADAETVDRAKASQPFGYLVKPFTDAELRSAIEIAIHKHGLERRLQESERWLAAVLDSIGDGVIATDADGKVTFMNPVAVRLTGRQEASGWPVEEVLGLVDAHTGEIIESPCRRALETDTVVELGMNADLVGPGGSRVPVVDSAAPIRHARDGLIGTVMVFRDDSERRGLTEALRRSEERYRRLFEDDLAGNAVMTPGGAVVACNPACAEILGAASPEEVVGRDLLALMVDPEARESLRREIGSVPELRNVQERWRRPDGSEALLLAHFVRAKDGDEEIVLANLVDVTERQRAADRLQHSQRMEALGRVAGGVAHDFNNLLTGIIGLAELGRMESHGAASGAAEQFEAIRGLADRSTRLVSRLLSFSRRQPLRREVVDLEEAVQSTVEMLRPVLGEKFDVELEAAADTPDVDVDRVQLEQMMLNLAVNARDAMPGGGTISVRLSGTRFEEPPADLELGEGPHAVIEVEDTGVGIDEADLPHVFEPFFTTKETGRGTGLGLASVYGAVRQHGGDVSVTSGPGRGSTFRLFLPAADRVREERRQEARRRRPARRPAEPSSRKGGILLVEDEGAVRDVARRILTAHGYDVVAVRDGDELESLLGGDLPEIRLLITDVVLPGKDGPELYRSLRERFPDLAVIFMSGYASDHLEDIASLEGLFLEKPFSVDSFLALVREALGESPDS